MPDLEKVINGIECCDNDDCDNCPYFRSDDENDLGTCKATLHRDALALLKAQEPMVMAGAELTDAELIEEIRKAPLVLKPNVDAVPVVRCKDCMYWKSDMLTHFWKPCDVMVSTDKDWYCPCGKRR